MEDCYHSMKRKELQALCKKHGLPANRTNFEMATRLTQILQAKGNSISEEASETKSVDEIKRVKKVKFSPDVETREYELSVYGKGARRITRGATLVNFPVSNESKETIAVSGKKRGQNGEDEKRITRRTSLVNPLLSNESKEINGVSRKKRGRSRGDEEMRSENDSRRVTRSRNVVDNQGTVSIIVERTETVVEEIKEDPKVVRRSRRNMDVSKDSEVMNVKGVRRVTRSSASSVTGQNEVGIKESIKGLGRKASKGKYGAPLDGEAGSYGKGVFQETKKPGRKGVLQGVAEDAVEDSLESVEDVQKASTPAVDPRRSRHRATTSNVGVSDELGISEAVQKDTQLIGKGVLKETRKRRRKGVLDGEVEDETKGSLETIKDVEKASIPAVHPRRSRRKTTVFNSNVGVSDECGIGEAVLKEKRLNDHLSGKDAYVTHEPSWTRSKVSRKSVECVGEVGQPRKNTAATRKGKDVGQGKLLNETVSGKGAHVIDKPRRSKKNAIALHMTASSNKMEEIADIVGKVEQQNEKAETVQDRQIDSTGDEFLSGNTPKRSTCHVAENDLVGSSAPIKSVGKKKQESISTVPITTKETTPTNISGKGPHRFTRSASRQHLIDVGKFGQQNEKTELMDVNIDELLVGNTPRHFTQHALNNDLVGSFGPSKSVETKQQNDSVRVSASSKHVEKKERSIIRVPVTMKDTTPINISGKGSCMSDELRRFTRSASRQLSTATFSEINTVSESGGKVVLENKIREMVQGNKIDVAIDEFSIEKTPGQSTGRVHRSGLIGPFASVGKKQQSILSRMSSVSKRTIPTNTSPPIEETGLIMKEASGERNYLVSNRHNDFETSEKGGKYKTIRRGKRNIASVGALTIHSDIGVQMDITSKLEETLEAAPLALKNSFTKEDTSKLAGESVYVSALLSDIGVEMDTSTTLEEFLIGDGSISVDSPPCQPLDVSAKFDNHDSAEVKGNTCDVMSFSDAFSSLSPSTAELENVPAEEELLLGEEECEVNDYVSIHSCEDIVFIDKGGCELNEADQDDTNVETEIKIQEVSLEIFNKNSTNDVDQETDGGSDFATEVKSASVQEDDVNCMERKEQEDTLDVNRHGGVPHDSQASPTFKAETFIEEVKDIHLESGGVVEESQNYFSTRVALTCPHSTCTIPDINDERQQDVADKASTATNSIDEDTNEVLEEVPADALPQFNHEKLGDKNAGNTAITKNSSDEILCQEDFQDCIVSERGNSFNNSGGEQFLSEASSAQRIRDLSSEKVEDKDCGIEEIYDNKNSSIEDVVDGADAHYNLVGYMVENQSTHEEINIKKPEVEDKEVSGNYLVAKFGDYGGSQKVVAEVNSAGEESSDSQMAIKGMTIGKFAEAQLKFEQSRQVLGNETAECNPIMNLSFYDDCEEVATVLPQSTQQSNFLEAKNVELNSESTQSINSIDRVEEERMLFKASDSEVDSSTNFMGDHSDAKEAPEVPDTSIYDGMFENRKAAGETCMMVVDIQQQQNEGTSQTASIVKSDEVISVCFDGLPKSSNVELVTLSEAGLTNSGCLSSASDGVYNAAIQLEVMMVEPDSPNEEHVPYMDTGDVNAKVEVAKDGAGKLEDHMDGNGTNQGVEQESENRSLNQVESASICDGTFGNRKAADDEKCMMAVDIQQQQYEGTSQSESTVKPDKVISICLNGLQKRSNDDPITLSEAGFTDSRFLKNPSDGVHHAEIQFEIKMFKPNSPSVEHVPDMDTSVVDAKAGDTKKGAGEMEDNLEGKGTNQDAEKESENRSSSQVESSLNSNWEANMIYEKGEQDAGKSDEEHFKENLMSKNSEKVTPGEQEQTAKLGEVLEDNLTGDNSESFVQLHQDLVNDEKVEQGTEMNFGIDDIVSDEKIDNAPVINQEFLHIQNPEDKEVENTVFPAKEGVLAEVAYCGHGVREDVCVEDNGASMKIPIKNIDIQEEEGDGGAVQSDFWEDTLLEISKTHQLHKVISSSSQQQDDMPAELSTLADTYCAKPEDDLCSSSIQQITKAYYEELEEQLMKNDEVLTAEQTDVGQKAGGELNKFTESSTLGKNASVHQDVTEEELDLQQDPVNEGVSEDDNDCLAALNTFSPDNISKTPPAETEEPHSFEDISQLQHKLESDNTIKSAIDASPDHECESSKLSLVSGEGEEEFQLNLTSQEAEQSDKTVEENDELSSEMKTAEIDLVHPIQQKVSDWYTMKENAPTNKEEQIGNMTAPKTLTKRRPLEDVRNYH
ncbi:uncharacterized protein LOC126664226 isoform X2 [Mercurialis annua]|uniref:uncharacterized protein LOC126664226 isoform X2 n=1 Tax=Mercurialis annua TaxID=3986 RepID=UPI0021606D04|nr:uncharacterized protein LOC126664226 isoform X2 [Mercurialis annua]